jgi:hypothetical protein
MLSDKSKKSPFSGHSNRALKNCRTKTFANTAGNSYFNYRNTDGVITIGKRLSKLANAKGSNIPKSSQIISQISYKRNLLW